MIEIAISILAFACIYIFVNAKNEWLKIMFLLLGLIFFIVTIYSPKFYVEYKECLDLNCTKSKTTYDISNLGNIVANAMFYILITITAIIFISIIIEAIRNATKKI